MQADRLQGLQLLRAVAAMMVLVGHVIAEAEHYFGLTLPGSAIPWTRGVDIFFVISGFVIALSAERLSDQPATFLWRRLLRVAPLYFVFTTLMVAVLVVMPGGAKDTTLDPLQILSSYGFFPYERLDGRIAPVLSLGWTLNYEVFFYVVFAICMVAGRPFRAITVVFCVLAGLGLAINFASPQLTFWTNPIILEFLFGIGLAKLWQAGLRPASWAATWSLSVLGLAGLILLDGTELPRVIAAGVPAGALVAAWTLYVPTRPLPWQGLGDASYALYLSHRFVLRAGTIVLVPLVPSTPLGALGYVIAISLAATVTGILTHRWIERPMMRAISRPRRQGALA